MQKIILILACSVFILAGCGEKKSEPPVSDQGTESGMQESLFNKVNYYNFLTLSLGMSLDEANELLGTPEMSESTGTGNFSCTYYSSTDTVFIEATFNDNKLSSAAIRDMMDMFYEPVSVTSEQFDQLYIGMTLNEIREIIGAEGYLECLFRDTYEPDLPGSYLHVWASRNDGMSYRRINVIVDENGEAWSITQNNLTMCERDAELTFELYDLIKPGMNLDEVQDTLGFRLSRYYSIIYEDCVNDMYRYEDSSFKNAADFHFVDNVLYKKNIEYPTERYTADQAVTPEAAGLIAAGMTEEEVTLALGSPGILFSEQTANQFATSNMRILIWGMDSSSADFDYLKIMFIDGKIYSEGHILRLS